MLFLPSVACASDPTPLFIAFVASPLIFLSAICLILSIGTHKTGFVVSVVLFVVQLVVLSWALKVGYAEDEPAWAFTPVGINCAALAVSVYKFIRSNKDE